MNKFLFAFLFSFYTVCCYSQIADTKMGMSKEIVQKMLQNRFGYTDNTDETSITSGMCPMLDINGITLISILKLTSKIKVTFLR